MEISYKGHVNGIVTAAWLAGRPVEEIWMNGEKLYPLEGNVATQVLVDIAFGDVDGPLNYWLHALDWHDSLIDQVGKREEVLYPGKFTTGTDSELFDWLNWIDRMEKQGYKFDSNNMLLAYKESTNKPESLFTLTIGNKTYKEGTDFTFDPNTGLITFTGSQMPETASLPRGTKIKLSASVPERERKDEEFKAQKNKDTSKTFGLPLLPGTKFHYSYYKGEKKKSAGTRLTVVGVPSNTEFYYGKGQKNGHSRTSVNGIVPPNGTGPDERTWRSDDRWVEGDLNFTITIGPFNNSTPTAYPIYPAFTKEWSLKVIGVIIKQI